MHPMEKMKIVPVDYAKDIVAALPKGVLLTTKAGDKVNSMVIGWGTLGLEWQTPIFIAFVREHRFTREQLDKNPEFTVNVPVGPYDKKIIGVCGGKCGRNMDKIQAAGLTLVAPEVVSVPAVREFPLTLECKVVEDKMEVYGHHVLGEIVGVLADESVLDETGRVDARKLNAFVFDQFRSGYYAIGEKVGQAWHTGAPLMK